MRHLQVTTFSVCPCPVAVGPGASAAAGQVPGSFPGQADAAVGMLAGVTTVGTVELLTVQRGLLQPLHASISASIGDQPITKVPKKQLTTNYPSWYITIASISIE